MYDKSSEVQRKERLKEEVIMKISLLEPIGVSKEVLDELSKGLIEKGHEFIAYDTKTTDVEELKSTCTMNVGSYLEAVKGAAEAAK